MKRILLLAIPALVSSGLILLAQSLDDPSFLAGINRVFPAGGGGDDCSSANLLFSWHMEDTNVTVGTPAGCSDGDETGTLASAAVISSDYAQDGTYSLHCPTASDYISYTVSGNDIVNPSAGTVIVYVYIETGGFVNGTMIYSARINSGNRVEVYFQGSDDPTGREVFLRWDGDSSTQTAATSTEDLNTNQWYKITAKYTTADVDPNLSLQIDSGTPVTNNANLTNWVGTLTTLNIGNSVAVAGNIYLDNIKIYDNWQ